eukprot:CAMPEP_0184367392 /NCGR_PEP_ID=MMETSP1089-20130417/158141_1 /TAXON_ID=38269 ORGANISM="Gloeochaete wittrockiana, Strain SAG46.84" /NCGR_SAMPLE_ID=MMETSP1089 /ASSEMBLY_ACC=CAM_ASM_000445 /LENGTH=64 /DNA_ID=CAMNT_0026709353 /DNA_START=108 /DNA_END=299 /DNA_ORIENTATION=+
MALVFSSKTLSRHNTPGITEVPEPVYSMPPTGMRDRGMDDSRVTPSGMTVAVAEATTTFLTRTW